MNDPDFNALGRYHHLCDQAKKQAHERQQLLGRALTVLSHATDASGMLPVGVIARPVNFGAIENLLSEARLAHAEMEETVRQIAELAPIVDKRVLLIA